ncbi:MAG: HpcH/HpaI aldolase/citrate lyase family protein [Aliishimia sp.]
MKLPTNPFLAAIRAGKPQIGLWAALAGAVPVEAIAHAGFDWILVDMEHSPNDVSTVLAQLQVLAGSSSTAIVRPHGFDVVLVKRLLDIGAEGLLFPMVQTHDMASEIVSATRYPPRGIRGFGGTTRANRYGRIADYATRVEDETAVLVQAETLSAMAQITEIGGTDGVDGVFFGPADIAADMGYLGQPLHPEVWAKIFETAQKLMDKGVPCGTLVSDVAFAKEIVAKGFLFVACGSDSGLLARGADALLAQMKA